MAEMPKPRCGVAPVSYGHNEEYPISERISLLLEILRKIGGSGVQKLVGPRRPRFDGVEEINQKLVRDIGKQSKVLS